MENKASQLFLLVVSGGEYSDSWSYNICLYDSLEKAEKIAEQANELMKLYSEKSSANYDKFRGNRSVSSVIRDSDWESKSAALLLAKKTLEAEYYEKLHKLIGVSADDVLYRWDSTFHVEQIPCL